MIKIRPASPADIERLNEITARVLGSSDIDRPVTTALEGLDELPTDPVIRCAESQGRVLGWGLLYSENRSLAVIFVDPRGNASTVSQRLVEAMETAAMEAGLDRFSVLTFEG